MGSTLATGNQMLLGALVVAMSTVIMWFSAKVVGVPNAGVARSFMATVGVSVIVGTAVTLMATVPGLVKILLAVAGLVGSVAVIRAVLRVPTLPAFLVWVVNVMMQMIMIAVYLKAVLPPTPVQH
jgi:hypothetical protein